MASDVRLSLAVVYVRELDPSVSFYTEVLGLTVADRDATAALLAGTDRSVLILRSMGEDGMRAPGSLGVQLVVWALGREEDLHNAESVLKSRSAYVETRSGEGYTVVEGRDPDGTPVLVAHPAPDEVPLRTLPARIYAW